MTWATKSDSFAGDAEAVAGASVAKRRMRTAKMPVLRVLVTIRVSEHSDGHLE